MGLTFYTNRFWVKHTPSIMCEGLIQSTKGLKKKKGGILPRDGPWSQTAALHQVSSLLGLYPAFWTCTSITVWTNSLKYISPPLSINTTPYPPTLLPTGSVSLEKYDRYTGFTLLNWFVTWNHEYLFHIDLCFHFPCWYESQVHGPLISAWRKHTYHDSCRTTMWKHYLTM